ncbi:MAG TPA: tRNA pseudouridine(55) synthase TruB [Opitutales bacterium]|jgi:tRNA pseudouridine55 synthase|nr:tRNA pseudouridine(55) synthase TruB [Opitutales bacterium]
MNPSDPHLFEGILLVDKPSGMTSHDVVARLRHRLKIRQIGHAGTLDPLATGLLVMLVGRATKVSQYLTSLDKEYEGVFELGKTTDSHDADGEVTETKPVPELDAEGLRAVMQTFVGDQFQTPPMFSAKKIKGVPLYKHARKGIEVEREPRFIHVDCFDLLDYTPPLASFRLRSSKGTYVRTIAHDLGRKLGCGATLNVLRRTGSGKHRLADATPLAQFDTLSMADIRRRLIPVYQAVPSHVL